MVYFVGSGAGAADLITVRGMRMLEQADVIIYAGSLVNPALYNMPETRVRYTIAQSSHWKKFWKLCKKQKQKGKQR